MPLTHKRIRIHRIFDRPLKKPGRKPTKIRPKEFTDSEKLEILEKFKPHIVSRIRLIPTKTLRREGIPKQDVIHDLEEHLFEALDYCKKGEDTSRYLNRSITNFIIDFERTHHHDDIHQLEGIAESHAINPLEHAIAKENRKRIQIALKRIPKVERKVLIMHFLTELSVSEIAKILGISEFIVRKTIKNGIEGTRKSLVQQH